MFRTMLLILAFAISLISGAHAGDPANEDPNIPAYETNGKIYRSDGNLISSRPQTAPLRPQPSLADRRVEIDLEKAKLELRLIQIRLDFCRMRPFDCH
jgi:hypothetical protein